MIGIKHEDKNRIIDYCIRECIKNHDALLGIRASIIHEKSEQINIIDNSIIFTGLLYYPTSDDSDIILSGYELQINNKFIDFNLRYIILNKWEPNKDDIYSNVVIRNESLIYNINELSKKMGYTKYNELLKTM